MEYGLHITDGRQGTDCCVDLANHFSEILGSVDRVSAIATVRLAFTGSLRRTNRLKKIPI